MKSAITAALIFCLHLPLHSMFRIDRISFPGVENWNFTFGPSAVVTTAGASAHGTGGAFGIALNKLGFSLQAEVILHSIYQAQPPWSDADHAYTFHAGIGLMFLDIGYSRMTLSSGETANGWHLGLGIPIPLRRKYSRILGQQFLKLYWRPTWVYFSSGYEVFHEFGLSLRFKILLEK